MVARLTVLRCAVFVNDQRLLALGDYFLGDDDFFHIVLSRHRIHRFEHGVFDYRAKSARAGFLLVRLGRYLPHCSFSEAQDDVAQVEELLILLDERIVRLDKNADKIFLGQFVQSGDNRKPSDKFRD